MEPHLKSRPQLETVNIKKQPAKSIETKPEII